MWAGLLRAELRVAGARSLKEKRAPLRSLLERLRTRFGCAASEVAHQNLHQRAGIAIALVGETRKSVEERLRAIRRSLERHAACVLVDLQQEVLRGPEPYGRLGAADEQDWDAYDGPPGEDPDDAQP